MQLAGQEAGCPNVAIASKELRCFLPSAWRNHPALFFVCVPIFGKCIGMRRHFAARGSIRQGTGLGLDLVLTSAFHCDRVG